MHLRDLSTVQPGCVLSKSIYTERGDVLLAEGTTLTAGYLDALRRRGFLVDTPPRVGASSSSASARPAIPGTLEKSRVRRAA